MIFPKISHSTVDLRQVTLPSNYPFQDLPVDCDPYSEIVAYLEGENSLFQAVENIALPIQEAYDNSPERDHHRARFLLMLTWQIFKSFTSQIPHTHDTHHRALANLLVAIQGLKSTEVRDLPRYGHPCHLWKDLPGYDPAVFGGWECASGQISGTQIRAVDIEHDTLGHLGGPS